MTERDGSSGAADADTRTWRVELRGDLDLQSAPALQDQIEEFAQRGALLVIVDLTDVTFLDSSGLRALVYGARAMENLGGRLFVEGASGAVARVLELTDMLQRLSADS